MQEDLSQLASELREETCPQRVLDEVERQISKSAPIRLRLRLALFGAVAGFVLVGCLIIWLWQVNESARPRPQVALVEHPKPNRAQVANQAEFALGFMGSVLLDASAHSEKIISDRAVPPLRNSIEIARNKIIHQIPL